MYTWSLSYVEKQIKWLVLKIKSLKRKNIIVKLCSVVNCILHLIVDFLLKLIQNLILNTFTHILVFVFFLDILKKQNNSTETAII